ncbi:MAG: sterol desaturase family protein [Chitinophagaceae bacterium]|nr:sterol desaturase family protein [Chitinophagaceae bacterium]MBL0201144.1 sterol desaturase family protein [Chitinophagaceae bacterium]
MILPYDTWGQVLFVFILSVVRYLVIGGLAFLFFYVLLKNKALFAKIQKKWPAKADYYREIFYSLLTFLIFSVTPLVLNNSYIKPYTTIYRDIHQHSMFYFWMVFPMMLVLHDTYFYFAHRIMHHPKLFSFFHVVHHKSTNPSPWASFAFQPTEAFIESGIIYLFALTFPVHVIHLLSFLIFMTIYNVYGHLGFELFPKGANRHWFLKWFNTSVNHNMHHQYFKGNYGLYFTWWDKIMNTTHKEYDERFEQIGKQTIELRKSGKQDVF